MSALHALAPFQARAAERLAEVCRFADTRAADTPDQAAAIARTAGVMLLQAPTGSGKTLTLGRTLEDLKGALSRPFVWLWFAPYTGLVAQTRAALGEQCPALRQRDLKADRDAGLARDGDLFVQTWAGVAATNRNARRARRDDDEMAALDRMLAALRGREFGVGVVVDEAHANFGVSAAVTQAFYTEVLRPDLTLLATATPNDAKLAEFERMGGVRVESRVVVSRAEAVAAGLNKRGLMLGLLRFRPEDEALIDLEQATLTAGWVQHQAIRARLAERGIALTPLMLVQVEDERADGTDPIERVRDKLKDAGVPVGVIRAHTSGEPDPDFHTLAYDPACEVLLFKVAVATGFDAPRAWTLVSVRPNRGRDFGLQIVGRIMRVHPLVRPGHGHDDLLDRGYVFLVDPNAQVGLSEAADSLQATRASLEAVTDRLDVVDFGTALARVMESRAAFDTRQSGLRAGDEGSTAEPAPGPESAGMLFPSADATSAETARAADAARVVTSTPASSLFQRLPIQHAPGTTGMAAPPEQVLYRLRTDLGVPRALWREIELEPSELNDPAFLTDIARAFCDGSNAVDHVARSQRGATLALKDVFDATTRESRFQVRLSGARVAEQAQLAPPRGGCDPRRTRTAEPQHSSPRQTSRPPRKASSLSTGQILLRHAQQAAGAPVAWFVTAVSMVSIIPSFSERKPMPRRSNSRTASIRSWIDPSSVTLCHGLRRE